MLENFWDNGIVFCILKDENKDDRYRINGFCFINVFDLNKYCSFG